MTKVFIMKLCSPDGCPRIVIDGKRTVIRDDFNKKGFKIGKLINKLNKV